jgi:hypothetical protein
VAQEKRFTEKEALKAYNNCKKSPYLPAICFAEQMGFSTRHTTRELTALVEAGIFEKIQYGNVYLFRPIKKE